MILSPQYPRLFKIIPDPFVLGIICLNFSIRTKQSSRVRKVGKKGSIISIGKTLLAS